MKLIKNTFNCYFIEVLSTEHISIYKDFNGVYKGAIIPISFGLIKNSPTPVLEDLFQELRGELQERDRVEIEKMSP